MLALADAVPLETCARALVIKLRHHGDVLLASPVHAALRAAAPKIEVDALVYDDTAPMLEGHPAIAQIHCVGRNWRGLSPLARLREEWRLYARLRERRYDLLVHLSEHPRGAWLARSLGARYRVAPQVPARGRLWARRFTHRYPMVGAGRRHQVELNLDALRRIGIQPPADARRVIFVPGAPAEQRVDALLAQHGLARGGFIHLHPASRWRFKCWSAPRNAALIEHLAKAGHRVVLSAAPQPEEMAFVDAVLRNLGAPIVNLAGTLSIKELGALTARARLFIGVDSMPMHLASAMGIPTLALFGPSGDREWGPWNTAHRIVTSSHSCRPCGLDGCGGGKISECLESIPVEMVLEAAQALLQGSAHP